MYYAQPLRTLVIVYRKPPLIFRSFTSPRVRIDGYQFQLGWGESRFTIAADRPVNVECFMPWIGEYGQAGAVLPAGTDVVLEYSPSVTWMYKGQLGLPGTTHTAGIPLVSVALGFVFLVPLILVTRVMLG